MGEKNLIAFKEDFVIAGPKTNMLWFIDLFKSFGIYDSSENGKKLLEDNKRFVILCTNVTVDRRVLYPSIKVLSIHWWNAYMNKSLFGRVKRSVLFDTYNCARQKQEILNKFTLRNIETLIPE